VAKLFVSQFLTKINGCYICTAQAVIQFPKQLFWIAIVLNLMPVRKRLTFALKTQSGLQEERYLYLSFNCRYSNLRDFGKTATNLNNTSVVPNRV